MASSHLSRRLAPFWRYLMPPLLQLVRPQQWSKNFFVLVAPFFDGVLFDGTLLPAMGLLLLGFCLASSSVYALNDAVDAELDRYHPVKRQRPVAAGTISVRSAYLTAGLCALLAPLVSLGSSLQAATLVVVYLAVSHSYSLWLKHVPFLDICLIASGFLLRVSAGAQLVGVSHFSSWLYGCVLLLAVLLVVGKRHCELVELGPEAIKHRPSLRGLSQSLTTTTIWISGFVLAILYTGYALTATTRIVPSLWMGLTAIPVWWGIGYYMQLVLVHNRGSDPASLLWKQPLLMVCLLIYTVLSIFLIYIFVPSV